MKQSVIPDRSTVKTIYVTIIKGKKGVGKTTEAWKRLESLLSDKSAELNQRDVFECELSHDSDIVRLFAHNQAPSVIVADVDQLHYLPALLRSGSQYIFICTKTLGLADIRSTGVIQSMEYHETARFELSYIDLDHPAKKEVITKCQIVYSPTIIRLEYDENDTRVLRALARFKSAYGENATIEEMCAAIGEWVAQHGVYHEVDSIGDLIVNGEEFPPSDYNEELCSGIVVIYDEDLCNVPSMTFSKVTK